MLTKHRTSAKTKAKGETQGRQSMASIALSAKTKAKGELYDRQSMEMAGAGNGVEGCLHLPHHADGAVARTAAWQVGDTPERPFAGAGGAHGIGQCRG